MMGDLCVAKTVPPPGSRRLGGPPAPPSKERSVFCEASRNLRWTITNTGINAPVYKLMLPNPDVPGNDQPLFQISKPNPNDLWWTMFYFTYGGHMIPPKRVEFGRIQKNAIAGNGGGAGTRVTISGRTPDEVAVWQTLGEGNEDMVEWIVLCAALNLIDEEIVKAASRTFENQVQQQQPQGATMHRTGQPAASSPGASTSSAPMPLPAGARPRMPSAGPKPAAKPEKSKGKGLFGFGKK